MIPANLRDVYAEVVARSVELRDRGFTHLKLCEEQNRLGIQTRTGEPWRHPQQIIKLLRSFGEEEGQSEPGL